MFFYDLFSKFYDDFTLSLPNYTAVCQLIVKLAYPSKNDSVLDIACGTGLISLPIAQKAGEVVGLDLSLGQLRQLKAKLNREVVNIHLILGNARKLPFRNNSFNIVTCSGAPSEIMDEVCN